MPQLGNNNSQQRNGVCSMHGRAPLRIRKPSAKCLHPNIRDVTNLIRGLFLFFTSLCSFSSYLCSVLMKCIFSGTEHVCRAKWRCNCSAGRWNHTRIDSHSSECVENGLATSMHVELDEYLVWTAEKHLLMTVVTSKNKCWSFKWWWLVWKNC